MPSVEERFHAKVRRRGGHDVWTGSRDGRGVGMVRIDGKLKTVQRAAWEFAHGPLEPGARVNSCAVVRACVTIAHLSLAHASRSSAVELMPTRRRRKGAGSMREVRPDVWKLTVSDGERRRFVTVHGSRDDASIELDRLAHVLERRDLGDLRVRELVSRHLTSVEPPARASEREQALLHDVIEPNIGDHLAALTTADDIERAMETAAAAGSPLPDVRDAVRLLRRSYQWAEQRRWTSKNPAADVDTRWLGR
ncbi:MAG: hypothetical protein V7636_676 [Actinomycetota bacterium]